MGPSVKETPIATRVMLPFALGLLGGGLSGPGAGWPGLAVAVLTVVIAIGGVVVMDALPRRVVAAAVAAGVALGALATAFASLPLPADHLARFAGPGSSAVEGTIVSSDQAGSRLALVLRVEHVRSRRRDGPASGRLAVTIAHGRQVWSVGSRVRAVGRLRRPRNFGNPGGYDVVATLARRGIRVTMFLWDDEHVERLAALPTGRGAWLDRVRRTLAAHIARRTEEPVRGYLTAVLLGATQSMDRATRAALTRTGLAHVISVSGFHVAVAAGAFFFLVRWLALRIGGLALHVDVAKLAALAGLLPVGVYAAIAGDSVPAARAFLMYGVLLGALLCDRPPDGFRALAAAAVLLAIPAPDIAADVSFELSFVSVAALILVARGRGPREAAAWSSVDAPVAPVAVLAGAGPRAWWQRFIVQSLVVSVAATVATAPLTAWHFQQVSLIAPLANLIALPLLGPATLLPGLAALPLVVPAPGWADALLVVAGWAAGLGLALSVWLARLPWAAIATPMPSLLELALCYAALALWWFGPAARGAAPGRNGRSPHRIAIVVVAVLALADVGYWLWERFGNATLRVTFLSVGQGDAAVVELPRGGVLAIDGGGFPGDFDPGERLIAPFLRSRKILHLDVVVLSHPQMDHYGGLRYLAQSFAPDEFWSNGMRAHSATFDRLQEELAAAGTRSVVLTRGTSRALGGDVVAHVLHPDRPDGADVNDASVVLRLTYGATAMLFTGDIEREAEGELLLTDAVLASDVLKVAHHGSATSSTGAWVAAVRPTIAIISSGADNRFGFPAPEVVRRLRAVGATVWNTADSGAVRVVSDGRHVRVAPARAAPERFEFPRSLW